MKKVAVIALVVGCVGVLYMSRPVDAQQASVPFNVGDTVSWELDTVIEVPFSNKPPIVAKSTCKVIAVRGAFIRCDGKDDAEGELWENMLMRPEFRVLRGGR